MYWSMCVGQMLGKMDVGSAKKSANRAPLHNEKKAIGVTFERRKAKRWFRTAYTINSAKPG